MESGADFDLHNLELNLEGWEVDSIFYFYHFYYTILFTNTCICSTVWSLAIYFLSQFFTDINIFPFEKEKYMFSVRVQPLLVYSIQGCFFPVLNLTYNRLNVVSPSFHLRHILLSLKHVSVYVEKRDMWEEHNHKTVASCVTFSRKSQIKRLHQYTKAERDYIMHQISFQIQILNSRFICIIINSIFQIGFKLRGDNKGWGRTFGRN